MSCLLKILNITFAGVGWPLLARGAGWLRARARLRALSPCMHAHEQRGSRVSPTRDPAHPLARAMQCARQERCGMPFGRRALRRAPCKPR